MSGPTIVKSDNIVRIVKEDKTLVIQTVTLSGSGGGGGGGGWIYITDLAVAGGTVTDKVYQDSGNTVLQSAKVSAATFNVLIRASYPIVEVNGVPATLTRAVSGGHYEGSISVTLPGTTGIVRVVTQLPDDLDGASDTCTVEVVAPPQILTLQFTGGYPGAQTELKVGDSFAISGTLDKPANAIDILDYGAFAASLQTIVAGTSFMVSGTVADRGTLVQSLPARVRARDAVTGAFGPTRDTNQGGGVVDGVNLVKLNNIYPSVSWGTPTYPGSQQALKNVETATVPLTVSNGDTILIDSPNGDLSITNPTVIETPKTVQRIGGVYNVSTNNLRAAVTRTANAAQTTAQRVVNIAHAAATVAVSEPATRLRSGGNDGTAAQLHTITITSDQQLLSAPSLSPDSGGARGVFTGGGFVGGPSSWTRSLQVVDNDEKGTFSWQSLSATNLAGIVTATITGNSTYVLGGFVSRTVTWDAFQTISRNVNVAVADFSKLQAGLFSATNQQSVKWPIGTLPPHTDGYTISALATKPHTVTWLDTTAAGSNTGEAYLFNYQEVV